ncbi:MAG: hypothetical protein NZ602_15050 [Thermoguttaceae bacterium]|nr:hypothetical protein [Thermoguttaceae bacterium]MDW8039188.1 hypothetical protein [Thermoguttaceae bacterium]
MMQRFQKIIIPPLMLWRVEDAQSADHHASAGGQKQAMEIPGYGNH